MREKIRNSEIAFLTKLDCFNEKIYNHKCDDLGVEVK